MATRAQLLAIRLATPNPRNLPTVHIFHHKGAPPTQVLDLFPATVPLEVVYDRALWIDTDLSIYTAGGDTTSRTRLGHQLGASYTVILPAATNWAAHWIGQQLGEGRDAYLFLPYPKCEAHR